MHRTLGFVGIKQAEAHSLPFAVGSYPCANTTTGRGYGGWQASGLLHKHNTASC
jgi:hypothetical protein